MAEPTFEDEIDPELLSALGDTVDPSLLAQLGDSIDPEGIDPEIAQRDVSAYAIDPELTEERIGEMGELTDIGSMLEGRERGMMDTVGENLSQAALNAVTMDPMELADILTNRFPEDVEVRLSPEGVPVARNKHTGYEVAINKPGLSPMDIYQAIGLIGQYTPAGKFATAPLKLAGKGLLGTAKKESLKAATKTAAKRAMGAEGATEYASQKAQEAAGGRMDAGEVAFTAMTAPIPELVATPIANTARRTYNILKDNVVIDQGIQKAIDFARATGRKIATSDVLMETIKPRRRIFLKAAERIPIVGTGDMRLRQAAERADTLETMFSNFGISDTDYAQYLSNNFRNQSMKNLSEMSRLRASAFDRMQGKGYVAPTKMMHLIEDEMEKVLKLEPDQRRSAQSWLRSVYKDFDGLDNFTFRDADTFLSSVMEGVDDTAKGQMKERVAKALYADMKKHATNLDTKAFNQWDLARNLGIKELKGVEDKALREALKTGEIHPGIIDRLLEQGRNKDIDAFVRRTDTTGRDLLRRRVFSNAVRKAGGDPTDLSTLKVSSLLRVLDSDPATAKGMARFWTDEDRNLVSGAKEYLRATQTAANAYDAIGMLAGGAAGGGGKRMIMGALSALFPPTLAIVGAARAHESDAVRDLLLKLYAAEPASAAARHIMGELRPMVLALGQRALDEGRDPFAPEVEPTMFEKFLGSTGLVGKQMIETVGEFVEPSIDKSMDYLRSITGTQEDKPAP